MELFCVCPTRRVIWVFNLFLCFCLLDGLSRYIHAAGIIIQYISTVFNVRESNIFSTLHTLTLINQSHTHIQTCAIRQTCARVLQLFQFVIILYTRDTMKQVHYAEAAPTIQQHNNPIDPSIHIFKTQTTPNLPKCLNFFCPSFLSKSNITHSWACCVPSATMLVVYKIKNHQKHKCTPTILHTYTHIKYINMRVHE